MRDGSKTAEVQIDDQDQIELAEQCKEAEEAATDLFELWHRFTGEGACVPSRYDPDMMSEQGKAACFIVAILSPKLDAIEHRLISWSLPWLKRKRKDDDGYN